MRPTPAQKHLQRKLAGQGSAPGTAPSGAVTEDSVHELLQAQLYEHRRTLKAVQSIERKIELKRDFLPLYHPWVQGTLEADHGTPDTILTTVFVWCMDVGDFERALAIGAYILRHRLQLPDQYNRDPATTLIDEIADAALKGKVPESLTVLQQVHQLTESHDVPDQARAKLFKAIAYAIVGRTAQSEVDYKQLPVEQATAALPHLHRALELFSGVGVKKDIERLERRVKDAEAPPP
ncbi:phage terminase small subunit [Hydrogenophaga sp.]|uniref:phage terminase small subunit n=1 Tax=Hydrogenophaga sp. TaxID=1904254 RepID=UPI003F6EE46A